MKNRTRSTLLGAALIFVGVLTGAFLGHQLLQTRDRPLLKQPQGGMSRQEQTVPVVAPVTLCFTAAEAKLATIRYADDCGYRPDVTALVEQALDWHLAAQEPTVLIIHTHATESYTKVPGQDYKESSEYRTLNTDYNMVALGDALAQLLEQAGISVLHDRQLHDYPSYNSAYNNSRQSARDYLQQYPSIQVVLDLHRDAVLLSDGSQYAPTVTLDGQQVAQLMLVVGSSASGMEHPNWQENLAAALKLQILLEKAAPGITRPTILRAQRFNHDLSPGAMIVEIGTAGNTFDEAMAAVPILAQGLIGLMNGAKAGSTS